MYPFRLFLFSLFLTGAIVSCKEVEPESTSQESKASSQIKLTSLPPGKTGIEFNNKINDEGRVNIFTWHFIYDGAGVAAGDINNDGLPDLYFTGNMVPDKLYLNKGNFTFEDITSNAGIGTQIWSSGVTMADVNDDGLLDIYVCKNSPTGNRENNRNRLYINIGKNVFREQAAQYGIDDIGFGVQSTFFDADHDGDLDMYLVNQPFDEFSRLVNKPEVVATYPQTDRIFFFENGKFVDKTAALGMTNARYGLNVSIGDFDMNGWTDIYVCNDYHHADHLYMNNNGRFMDELRDRTGHISFYSMGSDVTDINRDGWLDIYTLDMAFEDHYRAKTNMGSMNRDRFWGLVADKQHYQYMQNGLQLNAGYGYFSEVAFLAGVAKTDWSYSALFADLDHDADQDILITNGILRDLRNNDFNQFVKDKYQNRVGPDNYLEVLKHIPSTPIYNIIYQNDGDMKFSKLPPEAGFDQKGFSHGMAVVDLDRDGRMDVVINNPNAPASIYKNESVTNGHYTNIRLKGPGKNLAGLGCTVMVYAGGIQQTNVMQTTRGYFSSSEAVLHFGLGAAEKIDSIRVYWDHKSMSVIRNEKVDKDILIQYDKVHKVPFSFEPLNSIQVVDTKLAEHLHVEDTFDDYRHQALLPYKLSQNGPHISVADINGDGLEDFFIGGSAGHAGMIYVQLADGKFQTVRNSVFDADKDCEDQESAFFDADGDDDQDLLVVSGSYEFKEGDKALRLRLYMNDGKGNFNKAGKNIFPEIYLNGQCVEVFDADGDNDMDLFLGGRLTGGKYPIPASSILLINEKGSFIDKTTSLAPSLKDLGMVTDAVADDMDKDSDTDLLIVGEWMKPVWLINDGASGFTLREIESAGAGLWWTVEKIDIDLDGDNDFLLGNLGLNNKFGGSQGTTLDVYANDFDNNGDLDVVLASKEDGKLFPVKGREWISEAMPFILNKFPTYESYATSELNQIFPENQLKNSTQKKLSTLGSKLLVNDGAGNFSAKDLNTICQAGPIKAFYAGDFNGDKNPDFIYGGNHFPTEVETARYDALYPGICFGDGKGNFECKSLSVDRHLRIDDVRDIKVVKNKTGDDFILIANNNGPLRVYVIK